MSCRYSWRMSSRRLRQREDDGGGLGQAGLELELGSSMATAGAWVAYLGDDRRKRRVEWREEEV